MRWRRTFSSYRGAVRIAVLAAVSLLVLAAGCGGGSSSSGDVKRDWHAAADAMASGDGATACRHYTAAVSATLTSSSGLSCADAVKELAQPLSASERAGVRAAKVTAVTVTDGHATVTYELTSGLRKLGFTGRSRMVSAGGRWLIAPRGG
jgi:hypothetical protein